MKVGASKISGNYQVNKRWEGHVSRCEGLVKEVIEGRMMGKQPRGRKRMMLDGIRSGRKYFSLRKYVENWNFGEEWNSAEPTRKTHCLADEITPITKLQPSLAVEDPVAALGCCHFWPIVCMYYNKYVTPHI